MTIQNPWVTAKAILSGNFRAIHSCLKKQEKSQTSNLSLHLKKKNKQNPISRTKVIIKLRTEVNETDEENSNEN